MNFLVPVSEHNRFGLLSTTCECFMFEQALVWHVSLVWRLAQIVLLVIDVHSLSRESAHD